jgi:uncharacterized protein (TIGR00251 family)
MPGDLVKVQAHPDSGKEKIVVLGDDHFEIWVKEPPVSGRANLAIQRVLSEYFKIDANCVRLVKGFRSTNKYFSL